MGIGVPSICQVLVNQGLLVLSSCPQEHVQAHGLQLGLGLGLGLDNQKQDQRDAVSLYKQQVFKNPPLGD